MIAHVSNTSQVFDYPITGTERGSNRVAVPAMVALGTVCLLCLLVLVSTRAPQGATLRADGNSIELINQTFLPDEDRVLQAEVEVAGEEADESMAGIASAEVGPSLSGAVSNAPSITEDFAQLREGGVASPSPEDFASISSRVDSLGSFVPVGGVIYLGRLSKQVELMRADYGLSAREAEVAELLARGQTVARIAEELFVSENTVRTHSKRIYAKLDVHKKQQLRDLVESYDPGPRA